MKNRGNKRKSNTYRTFIISFLLILLVPVIVFSFVFIRYDQNLYEKKLLEQTKTSLELPMQELEQYVDEFSQIAVQCSLLTCAKKNNLVKYESAKEFMKQLSGYQVANTMIQEIAFYNQQLPEEIYTNCGTYSLQYYYQYCINSDAGNLAQYLQTLERGGWISLSKLTAKGRKPEKILQYVVQQSGGKNWIFTFEPSALQKLLEQDNCVTILCDAEGQQLYPYEAVDWLSLEKFYQISVNSRDGRLQLIRYLDEEELFAEMNRLKHVFMVSLILVVLAGGWLASTLAFWNDKPIRELRSFCESKVDDVPYMADNFTAVRFAMDQMERQMQLLQRQREKEHLLLQLLYGKKCDSPHFYKQLCRMELFQKPGHFRVFLAAADDENIEENWDQQLDSLLEKELTGCELLLMRYGRGNAVGIMKIQDEQEIIFREEITQAVQLQNKERKEKIHFYIGGRYELPEEVCLSYREVLVGSQKEAAEQSEEVVFVEKTSQVEFLYPRVELDSLYDTMLNKDADRVRMIMDSLCVHLEEQSANDFMCAALFCDVLHTIRRACEKLTMKDETLEKLLDIEECWQPENFLEMQATLREIRDRAAALLTQMCEKTVPDDTFVNGVLAFIRQNRENKNLNVALVAAHFGISPSNLSHRMKQASGRNVSDYIVEQRMEYAKELLLTTDYSVQTIADMIGYNQSASFVNKFKKSFLVTPLEYRMTNRSSLSE